MVIIYFIFYIYKMNIRTLFGHDDKDYDELLTKSLNINILGTFDDYILKTESDKLKLYEENTELFEFNKDYCISSKNLGVSQSSPSYTLDVNGSINTTGNIFEGGVTKIFKFFDYNGNDIYYNDGNVGLGTNNPNSILEVSNTSPTLFLDNDLNNTSTIKLGLANSSSFSEIKSTTSSLSTLSFYTGTSTSTTEEVLRLSSDNSINIFGDLQVENILSVDTTNNRVGIRNNNPATPLDIGNGTNGSILRFSSDREWEFQGNGSGGGTYLTLSNLSGEGKDFVISNSNNESNPLVFFFTNTDKSAQRIILCRDGGRVGVNEDNPQEALEVDGDMVVDNHNNDNTGQIISTAAGQIVNITHAYWLEGYGSDFIWTPINNNQYNDVVYTNYTPKSASSWIEVCFEGTCYLTGSGLDAVYAAIDFNDNTGGTATIHRSRHYNTASGGGRGNALLPIRSIYENSSSSTIKIALKIYNHNINDDVVFLWEDDYNHLFYIIEYNR